MKNVIKQVLWNYFNIKIGTTAVKLDCCALETRVQQYHPVFQMGKLRDGFR
jgi:hypothetical protein